MNIKQVKGITFKARRMDGRPDSRSVFSEVLSYLPDDLLSSITILMQDTGYISIRPISLARADWYRLDQSVKRMGGVWIRGSVFSHWSIPFTQLN